MDINENTRRIRQAAYARSIARDAAYRFSGDEASRWDIESIVTDLVAANTHGFSSYYDEMDSGEIRAIFERHEYDENGVTEAQLQAAMAKSLAHPKGWVAMIRYPERADMLELKLKPEIDTPEKAEAHLRDTVNFAPEVKITVFPLVG